MRRGTWRMLLAAWLAAWLAACACAWAGTASEVSTAALDGRLFVGTCYQPVDRTPQQIHRDIALMKAAGFTVVRMGDLSWDYFEPREGVFDFAPFEAVMDEMHANGIRVIVDIPGLPAPQWLHHHYPGGDLVAQDGTRRPAAERYMDDISDPDYRRLARRMATRLVRHFAHHPALLAFGYDNEIGNGFMSYSAADRKRFVAWLERKYGTLAQLNAAWATQRWSRRIGSWDEVELPLGDGPGPFERQLDLRRYWSDVTIETVMDLERVRRQYAPDTPTLSNFWEFSGRKGFDFLSTYRDYATYGAMGFYPGEPVGAGFEAMLVHGGLRTPIWFNEFTAGGGGYYGTPGRSRMWAHMGLILGAQSVLAWTFNSHLGGEEQALFGLVDHDDTPSWKLREWGQIAADYARLQSLGFPRHTDPQVALAYSFDSWVASSPNGPSNTVRQYITTSYGDQQRQAFEPLFRDNLDVAVVHVAHEDLARFRMVVVPGDYLMDTASATALRDYVAGGGTLVMTAFSAKVDEHNQWFATPLPGRLHDVFGLHTNEFYTAGAPLVVQFGEQALTLATRFYEVLEPSTAAVRATFPGLPGAPPAITENHYGKGLALYVATPADAQLLRALYRSLYGPLGLHPGPATPEGVYAREVDGRRYYVNTTGSPQVVPAVGPGKGLLGAREITRDLDLEPFGVELVQ